MNIGKLVKQARRDYLQTAGLDYGRAFWRPIISRWLVWLGCSWAIGSVLLLAPIIAKAIKRM